jgi:PPE-repeat protein
MEFAALPPEVNSGRMYVGPGSGPMLAAAAAWDGLAAELHSTAASCGSLISGLTSDSWLGPASASMAVAAAPFVTWLTTAGAQAEQTATQAKVAAAAYETAFVATVPPPVIAANRSLLMALIATNILGQNTAAIATTEAQYAEMWAQDVAAMYGYAASSASATALTPFTPPQHNTNPAGLAGQAAAVGQATGTSAGNVQSTVASAGQAFSAVPNALQGLATAAPQVPVDTPLSTLSNLITLFLDVPAIAIDTPLSPLNAVSLAYEVAAGETGLSTDGILAGWTAIQPWPGTGAVPATSFPAITNLGSSVSASSVSAGLGQANTVGALSVPPTWTAATPAVRSVALALPATSATAAAALEAGSGATFSEMALASMAGRAMAGTLGSGGGRDRGKAPTDKRATSSGEPVATNADDAATAGEGAAQNSPRTAVTAIAAEIRELAKLRDEGILTDEEFTLRKKRLLDL